MTGDHPLADFPTDPHTSQPRRQLLHLSGQVRAPDGAGTPLTLAERSRDLYPEACRSVRAEAILTVVPCLCRAVFWLHSTPC